MVIWYWFICPECEATWGSQQPTPDREWCLNGCCNEIPELLYEEEG